LAVGVVPTQAQSLWLFTSDFSSALSRLHHRFPS
jgi:hypothetical protein